MVIQYRGWDIQFKKMFKITALYLKYDKVIAVESLYDGIVTTNRQINDCIIMNSIGIEDINSKPIYQKDIVKDKYGRISIIKYNNKSCGNFLYPIDGNDSFIIINPTLKLEVIGNIYENPELIKNNRRENV